MTERTERVAPGYLPKEGALSRRLYSRREMVRFLAFGGAGLGAVPILARTTGLRGLVGQASGAPGWQKPPVSFVSWTPRSRTRWIPHRRMNSTPS